MDEGAKRIESYFERARVREETGSGGAATSSGFGTDTTDSQTAKRKGDDETNEMNERSKKRQTTGVIGTPVPTVHVGGSSGSGGHGHSVSNTTTEQRIVVPPEVPQDTRRCIEDMEISQLEMKSEVREVQGVSLDADKRELQRLARDSAAYYFRNKQVEASDALIDEVGALLTESGGAQIIETVALDRFAAKAGDLRLRPGFAIDLCENKPYGPHEGECWDLSKNSDVKELFEMIAFERPMIVAGSPLCTAFSQFQNVSWCPEWEKRQATKLLHVAMDVYEEQIRRGRYFLHEHPLEASSWLDPRVISLQKRKGVLTASSPVCCFKAKIETKDGSKNVNSFVYKSTKWMTNSKALAEALEKRCSNSNEPPFHRHIVLNGGLAKMASVHPSL